MFPPLEILLKHWTLHSDSFVSTFFPTRIFRRGGLGFAASSSYSIKCRGLTSYPLSRSTFCQYSFQRQLVWKFDVAIFSLFLILCLHIFIYLDLICLIFTSVIVLFALFFINIVLAPLFFMVYINYPSGPHLPPWLVIDNYIKWFVSN